MDTVFVRQVAPSGPADKAGLSTGNALTYKIVYLQDICTHSYYLHNSCLNIMPCHISSVCMYKEIKQVQGFISVSWPGPKQSCIGQMVRIVKWAVRMFRFISGIDFGEGIHFAVGPQKSFDNWCFFVEPFISCTCFAHSMIIMKYIQGLQYYMYMCVKHMYYTHISLSVLASYTQIHKNACLYHIYPTTTTGQVELDLESVREFLFEFLLHCY